jgi:alpha,alpha-trehalose phosphorylase
MTTGGLALPTALKGQRPDAVHGIKATAFEVEPWCVRERGLALDMLARSESVFALSNGHVGLRGNLDEGEPHALPGTYLNSVYELRPLPYAEAGYGYPESGQTVINVTNGKIIRLLVDYEPFDVSTSAASTCVPASSPGTSSGARRRVAPSGSAARGSSR